MICPGDPVRRKGDAGSNTTHDAAAHEDYRMTTRIFLSAAALMSILAGCGASGIAQAAAATANGPVLTLAEEGQTKYTVVIAAEAKEGEKYAADELVLFLGQITGADFPITRDDEPPRDFEIVLGHTNRKRLEDLPAHLRTDNMEGFAIVPEGERLVIIGNIPRGTLYGVYDFLELALGGVFAQNQQSRGTEMQALRFYVLARAMWRPTVDSRETIEEFCRAYYGGGGEGVLRYVNFLHDEWTERLPQHGSEKPGLLGRWDLTPQEIHKLTTEGEAILSKAEAAARTPEMKHRVAVCRLPMWHSMLEPAFGEVGSVVSLPDQWHFKFDTEGSSSGVGPQEQWQKTTDFGDWRMMRTDKHWTYQDETRRGSAWYGIWFDMPDTRGAPLGCFFGSIDGDADVFIDGVKIG